ncbi:MAG TPA: transposase [Acidobacteriaceae bacterium]|nr:transposase [Acidobacteriaceae bacterium]
MAIPGRLNKPGTYFITAPTHSRRRLFQTTANAELFLDTLQHYRREGHYKLHAFVVMHDHIHLLLTPENIPLERALQFIKGGFSRRLESKLPVWQRGFADHRIRDRNDFITHREYIHHNPVRARLCERPEDYPFSSAHRSTGLSG